MLTTNKNLRIDTYKHTDLAYLTNTSDRYEISRKVTCFMCEIKIKPITIGRYLSKNGKVSLEVRKALLRSGLVVFQMSLGEKEPDQLVEHNWHIASEYLKRTFDYPFFNYADDGWSKDAQMMSGYLNEEMEDKRYKEIENIVYLPHQNTPGESLRVPIESGETGKMITIMNSVSATFGAMNSARISNSSAIFKKVIPSGGGRHPTECYIMDVSSSRVLHYCAGTNSFGSLHSKFSQEDFESCFGALGSYVEFKISAVIVLTCIWERNMFRYREPRTFRSVHLDAGHALANLDILISKSGLESKVQYGTNTTNLEKILGIEPLNEGIMCALMIGGSINNA